jgi:hypothetical protein
MRPIKKLELDKNFKNKLSSLIKTRTSNLKKTEEKKKPQSKFTISDDNTQFIPELPNFFKKEKEDIIKSNEKEIKFTKLMRENITEIGLMWESFDDSIKKIVLSEIIEKYYLYKTWKFNSLSFMSGFLFAFVIMFLFKVIT